MVHFLKKIIVLPASIVHQLKIVLHFEQDNESWDDLSDGKSGQRVLIPHDQ